MRPRAATAARGRLRRSAASGAGQPYGAPPKTTPRRRRAGLTGRRGDEKPAGGSAYAAEALDGREHLLTRVVVVVRMPGNWHVRTLHCNLSRQILASMSRRICRVPVLLVLGLGALLLQAAPAGAVFRARGHPAALPALRAGTEMTMSGTGTGQGVTGFIANSNNPFDPATDPYPPSNPTAGFTPKNEGFAGIIHGTPTGGGATLELYCIDIDTVYVRRDRIRAGHMGRRERPQRGLRRAAPQRVLPQHQRTGRPDRSQPEGRRRAGGDLVLQRQLRAEHLGPAARRRGRHRGPDQRRGAAAVQPPPPSLTITPPQ